MTGQAAQHVSDRAMAVTDTGVPLAGIAFAVVLVYQRTAKAHDDFEETYLFGWTGNSEAAAATPECLDEIGLAHNGKQL